MPEIPHILIVDDYVENANLFAEGFRTIGYKASAVKTQKQALQIANASTALHAAVIDFSMPESPFAGLTIAERLLSRKVPVPFVIITGEPEAIRKFEQIGFPFIKKPISLRDLIRYVERVFSEEGYITKMAIHIRRLHEFLGVTNDTLRSPYPMRHPRSGPKP